MFQIAKPTKNLKILIWGEYKVGKTTLAMQFPNACIIDLEKGSTQYQEVFKTPGFYPEKYNFEQVYQACENAVSSGYKTIIIDQFSTLYEWHLKRWSDLFLKNEPRSKGNKRQYYSFQPSDYAHIKRSCRDYIQTILAMDANIIGIARSKPLYKEGSMMEKIGETYDCEKNLAYEFDYILHIFRKGRERACELQQRCVDKDRRLPDQFALNDAIGLFKERLLVDKAVNNVETGKKEKQVAS